MEEGFADWTRKDFRSFTGALEQYGRKDRDNVFRQVSHETGKPDYDVEAYFDAFEKKAAASLTDWAKIIEKVEKGEKKIQRQAEIKDALNQKVSAQILVYISLEYVPVCWVVLCCAVSRRPAGRRSLHANRPLPK